MEYCEYIRWMMRKMRMCSCRRKIETVRQGNMVGRTKEKLDKVFRNVDSIRG